MDKKYFFCAALGFFAMSAMLWLDFLLIKIIGGM